MNIGDLIDQYEQGAKLRGLAPTQMNALKPVRRGLGRRQPAGMTPNAIALYVNDRRSGYHSNVHGFRAAKDGTIRRELGALAAVLNWAHQKRILKDAPPSIDLPPMSPPREVFLTKEEADRVWCYAEQAAKRGERVGMFACLALDTWARADAIETLTWDRVVHGPGLPVIDYRDPAKAATSKRRVPVPVSTRLNAVLQRDWETNPFGHERGAPLDQVLVCGPVTQHEWRKFKKHLALPGGKDITRHDLRRTGISLAVARGVDLMKIAQMAGDNYETVIRHYARFAPDYLDGVVT